MKGNYLQRMSCLLRETVFYFRNTFNIVTFAKYLPLVLATFLELLCSSLSSSSCSHWSLLKTVPVSKNSKTVNSFINYVQQVCWQMGVVAVKFVIHQQRFVPCPRFLRKAALFLTAPAAAAAAGEGGAAAEPAERVGQ